MKIKKIGLIMILSTILFAVGCAGVSISTDNNDKNLTVSKLINETKEVELQGAESVKTEIDFGNGKLNVNGDADKLMKAEFIYNVPEWKPNIDYKISGKLGNLSLEQPSNKKRVHGNMRYDCNVSLNNSIPMDMSVMLGVGYGTLDLSKLNMRNLDLEMGVGNVDLNLCGKYKDSITANINGGVGNATIHLPRDTGVCVDVKKGVGTVNANEFSVNGNRYVNNASGKSQININLKIDTGVGNINLILE